MDGSSIQGLRVKNIGTLNLCFLSLAIKRKASLMTKPRENKDTLYRFWECSRCHNVPNIVGLAYSIHTRGADMLKAGFGTDTIRNDPAMHLMIAELAMTIGLRIGVEDRVAINRNLANKREEIMKDPEYKAIMEENNY